MGSEQENEEHRRQKAEGRRQKAEGRRQKAEGRRQKAEGKRLKPGPQTGDDVPAADVASLGSREIRGAKQLAMPHDAGIGRYFSTHLVTDAESDFARAQSRADAAVGIVLAGEAELDERLQH